MKIAMIMCFVITVFSFGSRYHSITGKQGVALIHQRFRKMLESVVSNLNI